MRIRALAPTLCFVLGACSGQNPLNLPTEKIDAPTMSYEGTARLHPEAATRLPSRVAVLPFVNETDSPAAPETVRTSFYNHFSTKNYEDVELEVVDKKLAEAGLGDAAALDAAGAQKLGELLHADGLMYGRVTHFDRIYAVVGALVNVGAKVRLVDARSGDVVWEGEDVARAQEGDIPTSIFGAIGAAASAAMNMRQVVLLRAADELFRGMATTIPEPTVVGRTKPPAIASMLHDSAGQVRKAGDVIHVSLAGEPGMIARATLTGLDRPLPMTEKENGRYEASYTVVPGDEAAEIVVVGSLEDKQGNRSQFTDALGTFSIDTKPPAPPEALAGTPGSGAVRLTWKASGATDLGGYRVYRSPTPLSGFERVADTQFVEHSVEKLTNGVATFFRVTALDEAGNESAPSASAELVPRAQGATDVSGPISGRVGWWASGSPYRVKGDLQVPKGATLTLEPGTVVEADGGSIVVEGALIAAGEPDRGITFRGAGPRDAWKGLVLRGADGTLRNLAIEGAEVGLTVSGVSPTIESVHLQRNGTGLAVEGAFAKPVVRSSTIAENREDGVVVRDGAQPTIEESRIVGNGRHGFRIEGTAPILRRNTIEANGADGISSQRGSPTVLENSIASNHGADFKQEGTRLEVGGNWWGSAEPAAVLSRFSGPVAVAELLTAPPGKEGERRTLSRAPTTLTGALSGDVLLVAADSPYLVQGPVVVGDGVRLTIGPGVTLRYGSRDAAVVVDGGSIVAAGTASDPVRFVSAQRSPAPGDYRTAVELRGKAGVPSRIEWAEVRDAEHGLVIGSGEPEITRCLLHDNLQSGLSATGKARPKLTRSTITGNQGSAGVEISGEAKPHLEANNIVGNAWPVQSTSTQYILAQGNWWGGEPNPTQFIGNVDFTSWLSKPNPDAPDAAAPAKP